MGGGRNGLSLSLMAEQFRPSDLILVFVARKQTCDVLANLLSRKGFLPRDGGSPSCRRDT